jgi:hypothetical protein
VSAASLAGRPPGRAQIAVAIPRGSRRARSQPEALAALLADPGLAQLRADFRANVCEVWRILVRHASWSDRTTRPTRARVCEQAAVSESTWKRARRWLESAGYLGTVTPGTTALMHGAAAVADLDARNDAAVYVLATPKRPAAPPPASRSAITGPPTRSRRDLVPVPAREARSRAQEQHRPASRPGSLSAVARQLRIGPGKGITEGWGAWLARPFEAAAWSGADMRYAIDHQPDGRPHRHRLAGVHSPVGWLRWRLGLWQAPDGQALPSRTARAVLQRDQLRAEQARFRRQAEAAAAAAVDPRPRAAAIRAALGWRRPVTPGSPATRDHTPRRTA